VLEIDVSLVEDDDFTGGNSPFFTLSCHSCGTAASHFLTKKSLTAHNFSRLTWLSMVAVLPCLVSACSSGSAISVGKTHPSTSVENVKIYLTPPKRYEVIGLLESSARGPGSSQTKTNRAVSRMKEEAAEIGANGVILEGIANETNGFLARGPVLFTPPAMKGKAITGKAIFVAEE
jgi:hypothetical protein